MVRFAPISTPDETGGACSSDTPACGTEGVAPVPSHEVSNGCNCRQRSYSALRLAQTSGRHCVLFCNALAARSRVWVFALKRTTELAALSIKTINLLFSSTPWNAR